MTTSQNSDITSLRDQLHTIPELANVPPEQLEWLLERSSIRCFDAGEYMFKRGDDITEMYIFLSGALSIRLEQNGQFREVTTLQQGSIGGTLPFSRTKQSVSYGVFTEPGKIVCLHKQHFRPMMAACYELTEALVHFMSSRVRSFTELQQQTDKMAALGRMSAGLAHELNNPSAAIVRSAAEFRKHLANTPDRFKRVMSLRLDLEAVDACNRLVFEKISSGMQLSLSTLDRADREDMLLDWLEQHGVDDGFILAGNFVDFGIGVQDVEFILGRVGESALFTVLEWIDNVLMTERYVMEIAEASARINGIVSAVKSYSHLDRAPEKQRIDIHHGIHTTLMLLGHKIKKNNITVKKNFDPTLPEAPVFVGELNQVWTNLFDNAIDALESVTVSSANGAPAQEERVIEIITRTAQNDAIEVLIIDSGEGIPPEVLPNIFDPFYTTKPMGKGTGLGLNTVQQIIQLHNGAIKAQSRPGRTEFIVSLPL